MLPLLLAIFATTTGCNSSDDKMQVIQEIDNSESDLELLQSAKAKWQSQSGQFYTIQSQRFCECATEMSSQMEISVSDNLILSAYDIASDQAISAEVQQEIQTVDDLFALIEKAIADEVSIEVTYNEEFGYPESAKIDLEQLAVDGGLFVTLSDLEVKDSLLALEKVTWVVESFTTIAGPRPIIDGSNISLSVDMQNMQVSGLGGCNSYSADLVLDEKNSNISISNIVSTEMACIEPEDVMQQEQSYFATLSQVQFYSFDQATLTMVVGGDSGLHFVAKQHSVTDPIVVNPSDETSALQAAKKKWDSLSGQFYTIQSHRFCECEDEYQSQMEVNVLGNKVVSAFDTVSGDEISEEIQQEIKTVDGLFALIEKAIADGISINVSYNQEYGYPETAQIDLEQLAVDGGLHINLSDLQIKNTQTAFDYVVWELTSFDSIAGPQPIIENSSVTLSIDVQNLQVSGFGGCNEYSGDLEIDNKNNMTISNIVSTELACTEPENIMQQEMSYFSTLEQIQFFNFYDADLNMTVGADSGLNFVIAD
ncbi:DUF6174 domain-containing protein [Paraglaciecola arctica]|uniref:DUF6174 domain-containing protein n=1 Tax=Paraglaciecola arctica TaxID=1128911 RepID=UPI001C07B4A2|nr:DUF6174 domain-containing protein [Paraglaciecola arctica]MBU3001755.1 META domain-containing protein [Paraglaciecola arctica]